MSVRRCQGEVSSPEFVDWLAYYGVEPFGPVQEDYRAGVLASLAYNPWRKEGAEALGPEDFFPSLKQEEEGEDDYWYSPEGQVMLGKIWVAAAGGEVR